MVLPPRLEISSPPTCNSVTRCTEPYILLYHQTYPPLPVSCEGAVNREDRRFVTVWGSEKEVVI